VRTNRIPALLDKYAYFQEFPYSGSGRIRTYVGNANGFTARPL
jgi:hypothetical protein